MADSDVGNQAAANSVDRPYDLSRECAFDPDRVERSRGEIIGAGLEIVDDISSQSGIIEPYFPVFVVARTRPHVDCIA